MDVQEPFHRKGRIGLAAKRIGRWFFQYRDYTPVPFYVLLFLCPYLEIERKEVFWTSGLALVLLGSAMRLWCIRYIGKRARTHKVGAKRLIAEGPFAYVRNPIYIANMTLHAGACFVLEMPWVALILLPALTIQYNYIAVFEEDRLRELFGEEYEQYCRKVRRWLPRLRPIEPVPDAPGVYPWKEVLFREWQFLVGVPAGVAAAVLKDYVQHTWLM